MHLLLVLARRNADESAEELVGKIAVPSGVCSTVMVSLSGAAAGRARATWPLMAVNRSREADDMSCMVTALARMAIEKI